MHCGWRLRLRVTKAAAGDVHAIREVGDRMDGRVPQAITGDADSDPITVRTIVTACNRLNDIKHLAQSS